MSNIYYQRPNNSGNNTNSNNRQTVNNQQNAGYYQPNYQPQQYVNYGRPAISHQGSAKNLVANIILAVLSVTLVIAFIALVSEMSDINRYYEKDANNFWWAYESGRYADSIRDKYENKYNGVKETAELTQCYAVSDYFEAASLYKAAVFTGKEDKAKEYLEKMAKAYALMGDVEYLAEDIDTKLGIAEILN